MPYPVNSLSDVLGQSDLRQAFEKFATQDSASENLEFLKVVNDYKTAVKNPGVSDDELRQKARDIQAKFISSTASDTPVPDKQTTAKGKMLDLTELNDDFGQSAFNELTAKASQINLTSPCYQDIREGMAKLDSLSRAEMGNVFDKAHSEIEFLTVNDTLGRFKGTNEFLEAQKKTNAALEPIDKLEAKLDKLKNPSWGDRFKAAFKGGLDNVRKDIMDKIDQEKLNLLRKESPETFAQVQKQKQGTVQQLKEESRDISQQYTKAMHTAQSAGLVEGMLGDNMSKEDLEKLRQERLNAIKTMDGLEGAMKARKGMNQEAATLEKHLSVRSELEHEAREHSHHQGSKQQQVPKHGQEPHRHL
jgi:hypothetical protein